MKAVEMGNIPDILRLKDASDISWKSCKIRILFAHNWNDFYAKPQLPHLGNAGQATFDRKRLNS